jgi:hypothetical protein
MISLTPSALARRSPTGTKAMLFYPPGRNRQRIGDEILT